MKPYRLLRNNKESGPYSAEELIQMGLKAYDLIWEDGKSASWRYASEITVLKPYAPEVEEQPFDRFYKKPTAVEPSNKETTLSPNVNAIPDVSIKPQKPRIRIKADSKIIEVTPPQPKLQVEHFTPREIPKPIQKEKEEIKAAAPITYSTAQDTPDWKDMWLNWEEEKKAVNTANKVNVQTTLKNVNRFQSAKGINNDNELETKFSQSLDDIKERYVETVLKQKKSSKKKSGSFITVIVLVAAIFAMCIYMGLKWSSPDSSIAEQKIVNPAPQQVSEPVAKNEESNNDLKQSDQSKQIDAKEEPAKGSTVKNSNSAEASHTTVPVGRKNIFVTAHAKPINKNTQQKKVTDSYTNQQSAPVDKAVDNAVVQDKASGSLNVNTDVQATAIAKYKKSEPKIADYINVDALTPSANSAVGVKLKIQNVSDIPVDLVMVDLQYYDPNGRFEKGETVYVRNIGAGSTVTIPAPDYYKAAKVNYKVSMVSSEKNNLYLIAD